MKKKLLITGFCLTAMVGWAQGSGEVYAAPGMRVHLQQNSSPPTPRPAKKTVRSAMKNSETKVPAFAPIVSPVFSRFWHLAGPERSQAVRIYYQFQQQNIKYPVTSLRAGVGGSVAAQLTVMPDGRVGTVSITRRVMDAAVASMDAPSPAAEAALDAEVIRVISQMRFEPSVVPADTVTVIQHFVIQ